MRSSVTSRLFLALALVGLFAGVLPSGAAATACNGVRFQITNRLIGADGQQQFVRLRYFVIVGPQQFAWRENIRNDGVGFNRSFTSDRRRLQRLDHGEMGDFTLYYRHRSPGLAGGAAWVDASMRFQELCTDGKLFMIEIR